MRGKNDILNINRKIRLQLYKPSKETAVKPANKCDVYTWWKEKKLVKYPSSIYVTIKGKNNFSNGNSLNYEISHKKKIKNISNNEEVDPQTQKSVVLEQEIIQTKDNLKKLINKPLRFPNVLEEKIFSYEEGCFTLKFSNSGEFLASAVFCNDLFTIIVTLVSSDKFKLHNYVCKLSSNNSNGIYDHIRSQNQKSHIEKSDEYSEFS